MLFLFPWHYSVGRVAMSAEWVIYRYRMGVVFRTDISYYRRNGEWGYVSDCARFYTAEQAKEFMRSEGIIL